MANQAYPRSRWTIEKVTPPVEIDLITPAEFATLADDTELVDIFGGRFRKDEVDDDDTRLGFLAVGFEVREQLAWASSSRSRVRG